MQTICALGLGYIGLPTASMFATHGFKVVGVDVNEAVVSTINRGQIHIEEPGLKTIVSAAINSGNLSASTKPVPADVFILAVPTPFKEGKKADMSYVENATRAIVPVVKKGNLVILESTSPPGTTANLVVPILKECGLDPATDIYVAHCPERVLPGRILEELIVNDRIIGGINAESAERAADLYRSFVTGNIFCTDATTAELSKLVENIYRDVNIALANELAVICEKLGVNAWEVITLANKHPRVDLHRPGPGVGGHCISVDPWFIVAGFPDDAKLIANARHRNDHMPQHVLQRVKKILADVKNPKIAVLGVSYKGNVDDTRESPSLEIIEQLSKGLFPKKGSGTTEVTIYDPHVKQFDYELSAFEDTFRNADLILVLTDHNEFRYLDPDGVGALVRNKRILDTRNCTNREKWQRAGFTTYLIGDGRPAMTSSSGSES
jgi:UDP-N-acetyl-D-mannosaminuronic acid dehydrogenase